MPITSMNQSSMMVPAVPPQPHISDAVRTALPKLGGDKAARILTVADRDRK